MTRSKQSMQINIWIQQALGQVIGDHERARPQVSQDAFSKVATEQDERETMRAPRGGWGLEEYAAWIAERQAETIAFHVERYGEGVADKEGDTVRCGA